MTALFERVKETIAERILVKSWLDDETRTQALQKLNSLRGEFHMSPDFFNDTLLAHEMAEVKRLSLFRDRFFSIFVQDSRNVDLIRNDKDVKFKIRFVIIHAFI